MAIPRLDNFDFLFNNGRGIRTTQVDWAVDDPALTALISMHTGSGNTAFYRTSVPGNNEGSNGDVALVRESATVLKGYTKSGGAWGETWSFSGGGGGDDAFDWATVGNTDIIPDAKISSDTPSDNQVLTWRPGGKTWSTLRGPWLVGIASEPDNSIGTEGSFYLRASTPPEVWNRSGGSWSKVYTFPADAVSTLEQLQDAVAAMFGGVSEVTYNDTAGTLDITFPPGGGPSRTLEELQDAVAAMFSGVSQVAYNDNAGTFSITFPSGDIGQTLQEVLDVSNLTPLSIQGTVANNTFDLTGLSRGEEVYVNVIVKITTAGTGTGGVGSIFLAVNDQGDNDEADGEVTGTLSGTIAGAQTVHEEVLRLGPYVHLSDVNTSQRLRIHRKGGGGVDTSARFGMEVHVWRATGSVPIPTAYTDEMARDAIAAMMRPTANWTYDDTNNTLTLSGLGGGGLNLEQVQDAVAAMLRPTAEWTYDDTNGTVTLSVRYESLVGEPMVVGSNLNDPAASTANEDRLFWNKGDRRLYVNKLVPGHGATATFGDFETANLRTLTSDNTLTWRGSVASYGFLPVSGERTLGDVYFLRDVQEFRQWFSPMSGDDLWHHLDASSWFVSGHFVTEDDALRGIASRVSVGDGVGLNRVVAYDTLGQSANDVDLFITTAYTNPTADGRQWVDYLHEVTRFLQAESSLIDGLRTTVGQTSSDGLRGTVATQGTTLATVQSDLSAAEADITALELNTGVQIHTTQASYDAASPSDNKIHMLAIT